MSDPGGAGVLYVVATPIGNLEDLSERQKRVLTEVDILAAEDTRRTRKLLSALQIQGKQLVTYADHNEAEMGPRLIAEMQDEGRSVGLVSDAGTPCVADPGYRLVRLAREAGIKVVPIPGPSALTTLVSAAGLPCHRFTFVGFLPAKSSALREEVQRWHGDLGSIIAFVPTRSLGKALEEIAARHPRAMVAVGRELTKVFEEVVVLPVSEALLWQEDLAVKRGEATIMVALPSVDGDAVEDPVALEETIKRELEGGARMKELLAKYRDSGLSRAELYQLILRLKESLP